MSTEKLLSELSKPVVWPNGCNETAVNALRYLAENKRPIGGSDMYNTEHLYMIASELTRIANKPLYSQGYVSALLAELEAKDKRITTVTEEREFWRERVEGAEKEREEFRRRFNLERSYTEDADQRIARLEGTRFITWPGNMFAPVLARIKVDVKRRDGSVSVGLSGGNVVWYHQDRPDDVVAFALSVESDA